MGNGRVLCAHKYEDGRQCQGSATHDGFCPQHSPRFTDEQKQEWRVAGGQIDARKKNGLPRDVLPAEINNLEDVAKLLRTAMIHCAAGDLDTDIVNSLSSLATTLGKLQGQTKFETELAELRVLMDKLKKKKGLLDEQRFSSRPENIKVRS